MNRGMCLHKVQTHAPIQYLGENKESRIGKVDDVSI